MNTYMEITAYGDNAEKALSECESEIYRLDSVFSADSVKGELCLLNNTQSGEVSDELAEIITDSLRYTDMTFGLYDIRIRKLVELWGFTSGNYCVPTNDEIKAALPKNSVNIDGNSAELNGERLDLGAVAKGYTSARLAEMLKSNGVDSALIYLGGNVRAVGSKPDGSDFRIGIKNPFNTDKIIGYISISDKAVITSGAYQRYFTKGSVFYHHIIDPKTGYPAKSGLSSVTVISSDDELADVLSTAIYVGGEETAKDLYGELGAFEYVLVTDDGAIILSDGIEENFTKE